MPPNPAAAAAADLRRQRILAGLEAVPTGESLGLAELAAAAQADRDGVSNALRLLLQRGQVEGAGRGQYRLAQPMPSQVAQAGGEENAGHEYEQAAPITDPPVGLPGQDKAGTGRLRIGDLQAAWIRAAAEASGQTVEAVVEQALDFYVADDEWGGTAGPWAILREICLAVLHDPAAALDTARMGQALLQSLHLEVEAARPAIDHLVTYLERAPVGAGDD